MPHSNNYLVALYLILKRGNEVLLSKRKNTGYQDGNYTFPSGHLEDRETITEGMIREAKEELGIDIVAEDLQFSHVMQKNNRNSQYINFSFVCEKWQGEVMNCEEDKCGELIWCEIDHLPVNVIFQV